MSASYLPERPDQPECRYFMERGSCKYGPECKYHHPREKVSQLVSASLGPLGLPLRPVSCFASSSSALAYFSVNHHISNWAKIITFNLIFEVHQLRTELRDNWIEYHRTSVSSSALSSKSAI